jgi:hypothetical protein
LRRSASWILSASFDSTVPFSQEKPEMYLEVSPVGVSVSMNVREQLFGQNVHFVDSSFLEVNLRLIAASSR